MEKKIHCSVHVTVLAHFDSGRNVVTVNYTKLNGIAEGQKMYIFIHVSIFEISTGISFAKLRGPLCEERTQLIYSTFSLKRAQGWRTEVETSGSELQLKPVKGEMLNDSGSLVIF